MQKTKKHLLKNLSDGFGKVMRRKPGFRHFLRRKSAAQGRQRHMICLGFKWLGKRISSHFPLPKR
jgi:hypothetical protein